MTDMPVAVHVAVARVMHDLPAIGKDTKSPEGYAYRGIEAITKHLQPLLAKHGVIILPTATITHVVPTPAGKDGWQDVHMTVDWLIVGPDGSSLTARTAGIGRDRSDKGANKAQTQALKYLLLNMFMVADKADDTDGLAYDEHDSRPARQQRPAASRPAPSANPGAPTDPNAVTGAQITKLQVLANEKGFTERAGRLEMWAKVIGRTVGTASDLSKAEAHKIIEHMESLTWNRT